MNGSRIIIDLDRNEEIPVFNGLNGLTSFSFKQGDSVSLDLIFVASTGGSGSSLTDVPIVGAVPIVAVGNLEGLPTAGSFRLAYQSQATGDLEFDATPAEVQAALNLLSTIISAGGVSVSQLGSGYLIEFNSNGARDSIVADSTGLVPESGAAIVEAVPGDATTRSRQVLRFVVTPFAYQGTFAALPAPSASLESLIDWNGTESVTRLVLDNTKTGTIQVTFKKTNGNEYAIAVSADTDEAGLQTAISSLDGLTDLVAVYSSGFRTFDISLRHEGFVGTGFVNGLAVDASGCIGYNGFRGTISFNTVEAEVFLAGDTSKQATLEVVLSGTNQRTVLSSSATILADLIETSPTTTLELDTPLGKIEAAALYLSKAGNLAGLSDLSIARTNLGLGSMATETAANYRTLSNTTFGNVFVNASNVAGIVLTPNPAQGETTRADVDVRGLLVRDSSTLAPVARFMSTEVLIPPVGITFSDASVQTTAGVTMSDLADYAQLSGATFSGKVNFTSVSGLAGLNIGIGGTSTDATEPGDLWISSGGTNLNFRDSNGAWRVLVTTNQTNSFSSPQVIDTTSNTLAALRVTQKGTANAIEVEDATTPDTTRFVVDQNGKVGIGVVPDAIAVLRVDATGIKFGSNAVVQSVSAVVTATGTYDKEIPITINGVNYRIPCRQV